MRWKILGVCLAMSHAAAANPDADIADTEPVEEIVVTARKFEEGLLQVPQSVQVLSGDFLAESDLTSLYDLQYHVPGLVAANVGFFGAGIALRGVTNIGSTSVAVAPHVNGVYLGLSELALARMFDIDRIEVLKGPQGTLYGRNATGGSINVITRKPEDSFGAALETALGSFDTLRMQGHVNVPAEKVALRVAVAGAEGDGYIRNSVDDRRFAEEDYFGIRASVRARPSDSVTVDLIAAHVEDDGATGEVWSPNPAFLPDPNDIRLTTVTLDNPYLEAENDVASLDIDWNLGGLSFKAISGYAGTRTDGVDDCAGLPRLQGCVRSVGPREFSQWSQELRLESNGQAAVEWLAGLYYFETDGTTNFYWYAPLLYPGIINDYSATLDEESWAVFGQATYSLNPHWRLTGGLRLSHDAYHATSIGTGRDDPKTLASTEDSWDKESWRLGVEYSPLDRVLLFASVSTGYRTGGVSLQQHPSGEFDEFGPEQILAWEIGANLQSRDGRWTLLTSAFQYDIDDMQVHQTVLLPDGGATSIDNAGTSRIRGVDCAITLTPNDRLTLSAALLWMPVREFGEFVVTDSGDDLSGNTLHRAPEWTVTTSVAWTQPLGRIGELSANLGYNYRSEFYFTPDNEPANLQDSVGLLNAYLRFDRQGGRWYAFAAARNLLDADYFNQIFIQSSPGYPVTWELGFGVQY